MELDGTVLGKFGKAGQAAGSSAPPPDGLPQPERALVAEITRGACRRSMLHPPGERPRRGNRRRAMKRSFQLLVRRRRSLRPAVRLVAQSAPRSPTTPTPTSSRSRQHLSRRGRRRRHQLEGPHLRLHPRRPCRRRSATSGPSITADRGCFEFDQTGKFLKEIGQGVYGINFAQQVRDRSAGQHLDG